MSHPPRAHTEGRHSAPLLLRHNEFYGRSRHAAGVSGFALAHMRLDPTATVQRHTHETGHFILVLSGPYLTTARSAPTVCTRPTLIYNPPGTTHHDRFQLAHGPVDGRFFSISIAAARLATIVDHVPLLDAAVCLTSPEATALAWRLARECRVWSPVSPLVVEGVCLELMAQVGCRAVREDEASPRWLRQAREMLHDCCADDLSVGDIAQTVGVHPVHLARTFRRFFACSPGDYQRRCRLERAAALLSGTTRSLSSVALASGYADQSHFTKAFRSGYSLTPGQYRSLMSRRDVSS